jgi:hypothetical protein
MQSNHVEFEVMENFPKQTFRNRTHLLGANGVECLTVPTSHVSGLKILTKDIKIDYFQDWQRRHMGAIRAGYGKAPFFEHFEPYITDIFAKKNKFLVDLNIDFIQLIMKILSVEFSFTFTDQFCLTNQLSYWNQINAKQDWQISTNFNSIPYRQCFGDSFVPNLSILDLLMNHGKESRNILS